MDPQRHAGSLSVERDILQISGVAWDAIVIGAGPAGAVAAIGLARKKLRVLLVDRVAHPRGKVCGCCLAPSAERTLEPLGLTSVLEGATPLSHLRLHTRRRHARIRIHGYKSLSRETLDSRLIAAARDAGAHVLWPATARITDDHGVTLDTAGGIITVQASVIVVADGLGGSSARTGETPRWGIRVGSRIGAAATLSTPPLHLPENEVLMMCDGAGYLGCVRLPDGRVNAAAAISPHALRESGSLSRVLEGIVQRAAGDVHTARSATWRGTAALTRRRESAEFGRAILVGDAAGYIEPFTGEGMSWAIMCGAAAAQHGEAIVRGTYVAGAWSRERTRMLGREHRRCAIIASALRSPLICAAAVRVASVVPSVASGFARSIGSGSRAFG